MFKHEELDAQVAGTAFNKLAKSKRYLQHETVITIGSVTTQPLGPSQIG